MCDLFHALSTLFFVAFFFRSYEEGLLMRSKYKYKGNTNKCRAKHFLATARAVVEAKQWIDHQIEPDQFHITPASLPTTASAGATYPPGEQAGRADSSQKEIRALKSEVRAARKERTSAESRRDQAIASSVGKAGAMATLKSKTRALIGRKDNRCVIGA